MQAQPPSSSTKSVLPAGKHTVMTLDQCIAAWIHAKAYRSESKKTKSAYQDTLTQFRELLVSQGIDLDADASILAPLAQGWAGRGKDGSDVLPSTFNQRLSILSSFYKYAIKHEVVHSNPIERVERRVIRKYNAAHFLESSTVKEGLAAIDRSTLEGKRDYALLAVALQTGRRVSELAGLRYGHIQKRGNTCTVTWMRCKGNKQMTDELPERTTKAIYEYLHAHYGSALGTLRADAPMWVSYSPHNEGEAIGIRTISRISEKYLGTSKVHALRHTWAVTMHNRGAKLSVIGRGLGHSNLKTTSDYLEEQLAYANPYARALEDEFGI
jgi:integrase/recombinase XerD